MIKRSDPVPQPPPLVADEGLNFTLPVIFRVKGGGAKKILVLEGTRHETYPAPRPQSGGGGRAGPEPRVARSLLKCVLAP